MVEFQVEVRDASSIFCFQGKGFGLWFHLTRCLRTLRARLQSSFSATEPPLVAARGAREGLWLEQGYGFRLTGDARPRFFES